jgi:diaminohydroxyphosphoribosylaminopyrimidine deaminase/5-amino-6-(5-phosphoribosylamino)uracil reductase
MVGAVLVRNGRIVGQGWHRRAGAPHAEVEAIQDAERRGNRADGATLYVSLEPCCTHGRTPPCTDAIQAAGIKRVVAGATDPNPKHAGRGFDLLRRAGIEVLSGVLADDANRLNESFNHWIVRRTPFVTVKAAMTLDGKIATISGESKWITGQRARAYGMKLRAGADAILVGISTILADDPALTFRPIRFRQSAFRNRSRPRRIILDAGARTPLNARILTDKDAGLTTIVVGRSAPKNRVVALSRRANVQTAPARQGRIDLRWLLRRLGAEDITSLLVEGGGEVNASVLLGGLAQRVAFFYAPKIIGGHAATKAVAGEGARRLTDVLNLRDAEWRRLGPDLLMTARVAERRR